VSLLDDYAHLWISEPNTGCWIWHGGNSKGYGRITIGKKTINIPRWVCEEAHGLPPTFEHQAAHATASGCVGPACVNPAHLRWATQSENQLDMPIEKRSERARKIWAEMTPEQRTEIARRGRASLPSEHKAYDAFRRLTSEEQRERGRKGAAARWAKHV
jgi:hypothetical protein